MDLKEKLKHYRISEQEYEIIKEKLGREPNGIEWALFSALWSEHCSYKSSRIHLKKLYSENSRVCQSFGENAGIIDLGEGEKVAFKMESHNHPSFIEPYQGAATGVGGILRDIFTMGARPIALANYLCFGEPSAPRMSQLVKGVVQGIGGYGNCVGVPNVTGATEFHSCYNGNILVNAMAVGLFRPGEEPCLSKAKGVGNLVVYVGAKTGRDGIHGASMASESFEEGDDSKKPTVQIGDPFYEKLLIESCIEAIHSGLVVAIQDMGAAGLVSSSFEMASKGQVGLDIDLSEVPLRDQSLTPEEILLSESQERMLLVCDPQKLEPLKEIFHNWGLDAKPIGKVVESRAVKLNWKGEVLTEIDPDLLVEHAPRYDRAHNKWEFPRVDNSFKNLSLDVGQDLERALKDILSSSNGCSRNWIYEQYDQRVGARTAKDCSSKFGVIKLIDSNRKLAIGLGGRPHVLRWDAYMGGIDSVAFASLEFACKGYTTLAVTDCLNYGNPEKKEVMTDFVASLDGMNDICRKIDSPIISGNVSFYNESDEENISPTPSIGIVGLNSINNDPIDYFRSVDSSIFLLQLPMAGFTGATGELLKQESRGAGGLNCLGIRDFQQLLIEIVEKIGVRSSSMVGKFGLMYTLARMSLGGIGIKGSEELSKKDQPFFWFGERLYECLLEIPHGLEEKFLNVIEEKLAHLNHLEKEKISILRLGDTQKGHFEIPSKISMEIEDLNGYYQNGWRSNFESLA